MNSQTNKINVILSAIIRQGDKFLLVRDTKKPYWSFPQGKLDKGESLIEGIQREVCEETKLKFTPKALAIPFVVREHSEKGVRSLKFFFVGDWSGTPKAQNEIEEVKFFTAEEIKNLRLKTPEIRKYLKSVSQTQTVPLNILQTFQTDKNK